MKASRSLKVARSEPFRVLLVEDSAEDVVLARHALEHSDLAPFDVEPCDRLSVALERVASRPFDAILLDLNLPDSSGLDTLRSLLEATTESPIVVVTQIDDEATALEAVRQGAQAYVVKGRPGEEKLASALLHAHARFTTLESLRRSRAYFKELVERLVEAVVIVDATGNVRYANPAATKLFGRGQEAILDAPFGLPSIGREFAEIMIHRPGLQPAVAEMRGVEIEIEGKKAHLIVLHDLTARIRTEAALKESEARYELAIEGSNDGIWDLELDHGKAYYSPRFEGILGLAPGDLAPVFASWQERIHPEDVDGVLSALRAHALGATQSFEIEHRLRHRDGTYRWVLARGASVRDVAGRAQRLAGSLTDVTPRKTDEATLRESEARYRLLAENASDLIVSLDVQGRFRYASPAAAIHLGLDPRHLVGLSFYEHIHPEDLEPVMAAHKEALEGQGPQAVTHRLRRADGQYAVFETTLTGVREPGPFPTGSLVCVARPRGALR